MQDSEITLSQLKTLERVYAEEYWDNMTEGDDLTHLVLHNTKMLGLLASLCEVWQHSTRGDMKEPKFTDALKRRILGNYLIWATHYSNVWGIPLGDCFEEKELSNIYRAKSERLVESKAEIERRNRELDDIINT